jgi:hypothetical protein
MVACEASGAREHGHDPKHEASSEGPIMQEKEWTRAFGRCNSWSTRAGKLHRRNDHAGRKMRRGGAPSHLGRSAQAGLSVF